MKALTKEDVKPLYKKNYWDVIHADKLPSGVDISVSDMCVNAGPSRAAKILQKAVGGINVDGAIGPNTISEVHNRDPKEVLDNYYYGRQKFYEGLDDFKHYGRGWTRRNKETLELALSIV
jgi:lysozyme family protein